MKTKHLIYLCLTLVLAFSCNQGPNQPPITGEAVIGGLSDDHWTYFSFEKGDVVGTSKLGDDTQDKEWYERTDWDFAICGDRLKTNGGMSGKGQGGVQRNTTESFQTLKEAPEAGYIQDSLQIIR